MFFDLIGTVLRTLRFAGEQTENAVRVTYRGHFGIHDDHGLIGEVHREMRAFLNPRGGIAYDVIKALSRQLVEHPTDAFGSERILVTRLRSGKYEEGVEPLVLDQRLLERAFALDDVVEVDYCDFLAAACEPAGKTSRGSRLPDAPFA